MIGGVYEYWRIVLSDSGCRGVSSIQKNNVAETVATIKDTAATHFATLAFMDCGFCFLQNLMIVGFIMILKRCGCSPTPSLVSEMLL